MLGEASDAAIFNIPFSTLILEKLGQGGMGVVYKALDTKLNHTSFH